MARRVAIFADGQVQDAFVSVEEHPGTVRVSLDGKKLGLGEK